MIIEDKELKHLELHTAKLLKLDLYEDRIMPCCPHCGGTYFIKHGFYNDIQRYRCKSCKKTFSQTTNSLWYYSKKSPELWFEFMELFLQKKSLKYCADTLNINIATAFYWRHKIMNLFKCTPIDGINPRKLRGDVFLGCTSFQESAYNTTVNFKDDYFSKEKKIIIAAAKSEEDSMLILPICRDYFSNEKFNNKMKSRIDEKSYIIAYRNRYMTAVAEDHNKKLKRRTDYEEEAIKSFNDNAQQWFAHFYGIATKYLNDYLSYFILYNLDRSFDSFKITYKLIDKFNFIKNKRIKNIKLEI